MYVRLTALVLVLAIASAAAAQERAYFELTVANGHAMAVYDAQGGRLTEIWDHPYAAYSPTETSADLLFDAFYGVRVGDEGTWLTEVPATEAEYRPGTGVVRAVRDHGNLRLEEYVYSSFAWGGHGVAHLLRVENTGDQATGPLSVYALQNFHLRQGVDEDPRRAERASWDGAVLTETAEKVFITIYFNTPVAREIRHYLLGLTGDGSFYMAQRENLGLAPTTTTHLYSSAHPLSSALSPSVLNQLPIQIAISRETLKGVMPTANATEYALIQTLFKPYFNESVRPTVFKRQLLTQLAHRRRAQQSMSLVDLAKENNLSEKWY